MISPRCGRCRRELEQPGAIVLTPPEPHGSYETVVKYHVCVACFDAIITVIRVPDDTKVRFT